MPQKDFLTSRLFDFLKNNVLNISELTRTKKLTEILDQFAEGKSQEVYVIQNSKNRNAQGVLIDLEFFQELLMFRQWFEEAHDAVVYQMALERKDEEATISMAAVMKKNDLNVDEVMALVDEVEIE